MPLPRFLPVRREQAPPCEHSVIPSEVEGSVFLLLFEMWILRLAALAQDDSSFSCFLSNFTKLLRKSLWISSPG